jgi:hypothetical protein
MECFSEPTLDEVLSDPLVMDVMASDGVDRGELEAELVAIAGDIRRHACGLAGPAFCKRLWARPLLSLRLGGRPARAPMGLVSGDGPRSEPPQKTNRPG